MNVDWGRPPIQSQCKNLAEEASKSTSLRHGRRGWLCWEEICTSTPDELFDAFLQSTELTETIDVFRKLCSSVNVNPRNHKTLYSSLKARLTSWKCKSLWTKIDKRAEQKDYKNKPCVKNKVLVIGGGPCGLRTAIESALLGAYVVVIEKRIVFLGTMYCTFGRF